MPSPHCPLLLKASLRLPVYWHSGVSSEHPVTPEQRRQYRAVGGRLGAFVRQQPGALSSVSALQAVVADLAAEQDQLVLPLKELVSRPAFLALAAKAGSGSGAIERQALLQTMETTFAPGLVEALGDILSGFLDLPAGPVTAAKAPEPSSDPSPPPPQPYKADRASVPHPSAPAPHASGPAEPRGNRLPQLIALSFATALLAAAAVVTTRSPLLCSALGLCAVLQSSSAASQQALAAATSAEQALRRAQTLTDYRQAADQLERELLKLSGDNLTPEQERQRQQLQSTTTQARAVLIDEAAAEVRLDRARQALAAAQAASGEERNRQIAVAGQELAGIPSRSFSAGEADRLREQLSALERQMPEPTPAELAPSAPGSLEPPAWSPPPRTAPAPQPQPQPGSGSGGGSAPYRDQPLF